ncbi:MAG TPA: phosphoribosylglycinamide formyltransferase, partial [Solirubrobacterales bacterium]|nr:phosphoribosylglycinamide formyltransferase [Solirubrobacterales bacterium]
MSAQAFRVAVLASGTGTNLQAILDTVHGQDGIEVGAVASDKPGAMALDRATDAGIAAECFPRDGFDSREERDGAMSEWLAEKEIHLVVLAGYMQLLSPSFIERWRDRIVNVHPALLPSFPGLDAIGQALDAGMEVTGVTVHFVDEGVDTGAPILQRPVPVPASRDRDELEDAVHATEHILLPEAIRLLASGRVSAERVDDALASKVDVEGTGVPFGELTAEAARAQGQRLTDVGTWGPLQRVAKVAH